MPDTDFEDYDGKVENIVIEQQNAELETLAEIEVEDHDGTNKVLYLSKGGRDSVREDTSKTAEIKSTDDGKYTQMVLPTEVGAIGTYLNSVEQYGLDEEGTLNGFEELNVDLDVYASWRDGLTIDQRRKRALKQAEDRAGRSPHIKYYLEHGSWRTVGDENSLRTLGEQLYGGVNPHSRRCYENSVKAVNAIDDDRLMYVEGFALPKQSGRIVAHAWVEFEGRVIELTWPWHAPIPPEETVYYGVPVETKDIVEMVRRRGFGPYHLSDEDFFDA